MAPRPMKPLDPQLAAIVLAMRARQVPPPFSGTADEARARMSMAVLAARARTTLPVVGSTEDAVAEDGNLQVPVRIYRPLQAPLGDETVVFFHGGGFVLGSVELMDDIARKLCRDVGAVVVSVDYRLAPEHPFPAAHDDALAACRWALRAAGRLGGDPARVAVAGESAGANLAVSSALRLRDEGVRLAAQLLVVPGVDVARDLKRIPRELRQAPMLTAADLAEISRLYMGAAEDKAASFPPSPLRAGRFDGLPPTIIAVAGHDPLHDEGLAFAHRLQEAGVDVECLEFEDMFHPFLGFFEASASARAANDRICLALRKALSQPAARKD